jgi:chaperone required for assembly of F1-ATPase
MADFGVAGGKARRFYETATSVEVDGYWSIELDGRPVRTPGGQPLHVPYCELSNAIADEWNTQGDDIDPQSMPLSGLSNAAIDRVSGNRRTFIDQLSGFAESDLICYWADGPEDLVNRQGTAWQPLLNWASTSLDAHMTATSGIVHVAQSADAIKAITIRIEQLNDFELTAVTDLATSLSSVIIALAVLHGEITTEVAFDAAMVDEQFQAEKWGEDKEAMDRHRQIKADVQATAAFLDLIRASERQ